MRKATSGSLHVSGRRTGSRFTVGRMRVAPCGALRWWRRAPASDPAIGRQMRKSCAVHHFSMGAGPCPAKHQATRARVTLASDAFAKETRRGSKLMTKGRFEKKKRRPEWRRCFPSRGVVSRRAAVARAVRAFAPIGHLVLHADRHVKGGPECHSSTVAVLSQVHSLACTR